MTDAPVTSPGPVTWPIEREQPFDPPPEFAAFRTEAPIRPLRYPDGTVGWLVTSYPLARQVLASPGFSVRAGAGRLPVDHKITHAYDQLAATDDPAWRSYRAGDFLMMDPPQHTRFRRALSAEFTVRRMEQLRPQVAEAVAQSLTAMAQQGPSVDLVTAVALPVPTLAICDLIGVSYDDRDAFHAYTQALDDPASTADEIAEDYRRFDAFMRDEVARQRSADGTKGLLGRLVAGGELGLDEVVGVGKLLVAAGHHTTKNMIALSVFALLYERERWQRLAADPTLVPAAVEELLRYLTTFQLGAFTRVATEPVTIGDELVNEGESVTVALLSANRDADRYPHPDDYDPRRSAVGHVAFGHGIHMCLGQHLARIEVQESLTALLHRFPDLRLAVPADEIRVADAGQGQGSVESLPVTW